MGWPLVRLGEVISQRKDFIEIAPDETYARCRVQTSARGIILRDRVAGAEIKTKRQQVCRTGEFLVAEIDAKLGGYGIVPEELDGAIVSSHYFLFEVDQAKLLRGFLDWYSRTPDFLEQVKARGSTNYAAIRPSNVLGYLIPLPPLTEQQRIVARLDRVAGLVAARARATAAMEADMQAMLAKAFARCIEDAPRRPMAEIAPLIRRPVELQPDGAYPELGVRSFGRGTFHKPVLRGGDLSWQKLFGIEKGDLVFSNIKAWEGAFAVAGEDDHGRVGSHRYLTCVPNPETATADFLWFYLQSPEGLSAVQSASPGSADRNRTLAVKRLETIEVPVPPLETQRWFDRLQAKARRIRTIRAASAQDADALIPALLHEIFNGKAVAA